jgi:hypothetical protein
MKMSIDLTEDDAYGYGFSGAVGFPDPMMMTDEGEIALTFGDAEVRMTYAQFERWHENIIRNRYSIGLDDVCELSAEHPPPTWTYHLQHVHQQLSDERYTITSFFTAQAEQNGVLASLNASNPVTSDLLANDAMSQRMYLAGRDAGRREAFLEAVAFLQDRSKRHDLLPPIAVDSQEQTEPMSK